jgi:prepilin-type N-terminal cleavage/methylation domain-containing protein
MKDSCGRLRPKDGFTLAELLVGLGLAAVVLAIIVSFFLTISRSSTTQNAAAAAQQTARAGLDFLVRELRLAGLDPLGEAGAGIEFIAADGSQIRFSMDSCNQPIAGAACTQPLPDGSVDGKNERVSYGYEPAGRTLRRWLYNDTGTSMPLISRVVPNPDGIPLFTFLDAEDNPIVDNNARASIRTVIVNLTVEEPAGRDQMVARTYSSRVRLRNIGL